MGVGLLAALALPAAAQEGDLSGRVRISATDLEVVGVSESEQLQSLFQIQWRKPTSRLFSYLIRFRYDDLDQDTRFDSITAASGRSVLEPTLQLEWTSRLWQFSTGYRWTEQKRNVADFEIRETRGDWFNRFNWSPLNAPTVSLIYDRIDARSDARSLDETDTRLLGDVSYRTGPVSFLYNLQNRTTDNRTIDVQRNSRIHGFNVDYRDRFLRSRLSLVTGARIQREDTEEGTETTARIERELLPTAGLFAIDSTPLLGPLGPEPALIDGDVSTPTSINIGGTGVGGGIDRNIGLDLDTPEPVDRLDLYVDVSLTAMAAQQYGWDLYVSDDNLTWAATGVGVASPFNPLFNRFEMSFTPVTGRFVKIVSTAIDPTLGNVFVTEAVPLTTDILVGERKRRTTLTQGNVNVSYAPTPRWSFTSATFVGSNRQREEPSTLETREKRLDQGLSAVFAPSRLVAFAGRANWRIRDRTNFFDEADTIYTVGVSSSPLQDLDLALSYSKRFQDIESVRDLEADRIDLRVGAQLTRRLNIAFDLGYVDQVRPPIGQGSVTRTTRAALFTDPRPELTFSSDIQYDRIETMGLVTGGTVFTDRIVWANRLLWRPTRLVSMIGELRLEDLPQGSGVSKFLSVDWLPLPGGRLQWSFTLLTDSQAITGGERDQFRSLLRWFLRRNIYLDFNFFLDRTRRDDVETRLKTFTVALEFRF